MAELGTIGPNDARDSSIKLFDSLDHRTNRPRAQSIKTVRASIVMLFAPTTSVDKSRVYES